MKSNIWVFEETQKLLGVNQTEFAIGYCGRSESYIRMIKSTDKQLPTEVLISIFEKIDSVKAQESQLMSKALAKLQEKIAEEIIYRNTAKQHLKLREMLLRIVHNLEAKRSYQAPPVIII